jgi:hypothetical protein
MRRSLPFLFIPLCAWLGACSVLVDTDAVSDGSYRVTGRIDNLVSDGLVLALEGNVSLEVPPNRSTFTFPSTLSNGQSYSVTIVRQPQRLGCRIVNGTGNVQGANVTNVVVDCAYRPSCAALHDDMPSLLTGSYIVRPADPPFLVHCDMSFDDGIRKGGWTLIMSTGAGHGPTPLPEGEVVSGAPGRMPASRVVMIADQAKQVHLRTSGDPTSSITSLGENEIIQNLRKLRVVNEGLTSLPADSQVARWIGPFATADRLAASCAVNSNGWPGFFHACGNGQGLHVVDDEARWRNSDPSNIAMEVYVR